MQTLGRLPLWLLAIAGALPAASGSRLLPASRPAARPLALAKDVGGEAEGGGGTLRRSQPLAAAETCPAARLLVPAGVATAAVLAAVLGLARHVRASDDAEAARTCVLLLQFVMLMGSTIVVLDSWQLGEALHMEPGESGQLVGMNWLGAALGFVLTWAALRQRPLLWKEQPKAICVGGLCLNTLGVLLYLLGARAVETGTTGPRMAAYMQGVRFLGGIGQGLFAQLMVVTVQSLSSKADMTVQMTRVFFVNTIGIGSGPVVAAGAHAVTFCPLEQSSFTIAPMVQIIAGLGALIGVTALFPDISNLTLPQEQSALSSADDAGEQEAEEVRRRRLLIGCCSAIFMLRSLVTSGVEVGSALLLERDFDMDRRIVGFAVGATFLAAFPMRLAHQQLRQRISLANQFRIFAGLAALGTLLLLRPVGAMLPHGLAVLLADSVIFPCAFLADGLSYGIMMQNVFPEGSLLDKNHSALWCNLLAFTAGRFGGPWMARWHLEALGRAGQDRYALWQMLSCIASLSLFEAGVRPGIKT